MKASTGELEALVGRLRAAGCVFAEEEATLLLAAAPTAAELESMVRQRVSGLPLEPILGWVDFAGLRIVVGPGVFVPRRRTQYLAHQAQAHALAGGEQAPVVVELCCGVAAVARAVAAAVPGAQLYAADIDPAAVKYARRNLAGIGSVYLGDLYEPLPAALRGRVHVLMANAPYVPTAAIAMMPAEARLHEALVALDGGEDGLDLQRRVVGEAAKWLAPNGHLLVETSRQQAGATAEIFARSGLHPSIVRSEKLDATVVLGGITS